MKTAFERLIETQEGLRQLCIEQTITNVTELLCKHLDESGMSRKELAEHMNVTPGRVSQLLDGNANLTLSSIAKALAAFGRVLEISSRPIEESGSQWFQPRGDVHWHQVSTCSSPNYPYQDTNSKIAPMQFPNFKLAG